MNCTVQTPTGGVPIDSSEFGNVIAALARFRAMHDQKVQLVRDYAAGDISQADYAEAVTEFAFDLAGDGLGLARAVAALLRQDDLTPLFEK